MFFQKTIIDIIVYDINIINMYLFYMYMYSYIHTIT